MATATKKFWTRAEVAAAFGVTPSAVDKWRREGRIRAVRTPGGRVRFVMTDELAQIAEGSP
jgi:excisionase family DNA binding protein